MTPFLLAIRVTLIFACGGCPCEASVTPCTALEAVCQAPAADEESTAPVTSLPFSEPVIQPVAAARAAPHLYGREFCRTGARNHCAHAITDMRLPAGGVALQRATPLKFQASTSFHRLK